MTIVWIQSRIIEWEVLKARQNSFILCRRWIYITKQHEKSKLGKILPLFTDVKPWYGYVNLPCKMLLKFSFETNWAKFQKRSLTCSLYNIFTFSVNNWGCVSLPNCDEDRRTSLPGKGKGPRAVCPRLCMRLEHVKKMNGRCQVDNANRIQSDYKKRSEGEWQRK